MYVFPDFVQVQTPGSKDILVFQKRKNRSAMAKPEFHFGFRLQKPVRLKNLMAQIVKAGGKIKETGEFIPGEPYLFFYDPDGYEVEIWFENIPVSLKSFN